MVLFELVSPRGSNQEYRQGVLSTLSTHLPRGRAWCRHREVPSDRNRSAAPVLGSILPLLIFGLVSLQRRVWPLVFSETWHLVMWCSPLKVSMGDKRWCGRNDSQCSSGDYLLILVSTEKVRIELVDLRCEWILCVSAALQVWWMHFRDVRDPCKTAKLAWG